MNVRLTVEYIRRMVAVLTALSLAAMVFAGCQPTQPVEDVKTTLNVSSPAFEEGSRIPAKYSCQGEDVSPALQWGEPPQGTQSFALIMDDPDAPVGIFTHWVLFNIPSDSRGLPEAVPDQQELPSGGRQGKNGFGRVGYGGPCPPPGRPHCYQFTIYALNQYLNLKAGISKKQLLEAMKGHVLAQGQLTGTYQR